MPFKPLKQLTFANGTIQAMPHDARYRITSNVITGNAELADLVADYRGIKCGIKALSGSQTVDACCKSCYP